MYASRALCFFVDYFENERVCINIRMMKRAMKATNPVPDSKVHGANMGPIWGRQDPGGSHVGPWNFAIRGCKNVTLAVSFCCTDKVALSFK